MKTELLTIAEFCAATNMGRTNLYKLMASGKIPAKKFGKKTLIPRAAMQEWIDSLPSYLEGEKA